MENVISALDEYFCAHFTDYVRLSAIEGYKMPALLSADGDRSYLLLKNQKECAAILAEFKEGLVDTDFTFSFRFRPVRDRIADPFRKFTFAKVLKNVFTRAGETAEGVGERLTIDPAYWKKIAAGKLYPELPTVLAVVLLVGARPEEVQSLLNVCGFTLRDDCVRDVVVRYLLEQRVFSVPLILACLKEYRVSLPIKGAEA